MNSKDIVCLTPDVKWDIENVSVSPLSATSSSVLYAVNEDGISKLYLIEPEENGEEEEGKKERKD